VFGAGTFRNLGTLVSVSDVVDDVGETDPEEEVP
jgi:hypothetical protein